MRNPIVSILTITLAVVTELWALAPGSDAPPILQAEQLMVERKFDDVLAHLRATVEQYRADNPAISAMAQYRLGLYLGYIKEQSPNREYWLAQVETELRKVEVDFPTQIEAVSLARIKLIDALLGQKKIDEARQVAQILVDTTAEWPEYNAWGRLKLVEIGHTVAPGMSGDQITVAQRAAIPQLHEVVSFSQAEFPEVANWARIGLLNLRTQLLTPMTTSAEFDDLTRVCADVLADHASGRIGDKQAAWALLLEAKAFARQKRFEEAVGPLQMAMAIADPNHLDVKYMAEGDLRGVYCKMVDRDYLAAQEAIKKGDRVAARALLAEAYDRVGLAGGLRWDDIPKSFAQLAESNGDYDEAIAWYRLLIRDPKKIEGRAGEAVEAIARLYSTRDQIGNELTWRMYLLDPVQSADPTAALVSTFVGVQAPVASDAPLQNVAQRHIALGKLYRREGRLPEARAAFEQAVSSASSHLDKGEAVFGLVNTLTANAKAAEQAGQEQQAEALFAEATSYANEAVESWLQVALHDRRTDAHYATEQALYGLARINQYEQALSTAERFLTELGPNAEVSKIAFAEYMRMRALAWNDRYAEAARAGQDLQQRFAPFDADGYVRTICAAALIRTSGYLSKSGDPQSGIEFLNLVESRYPDQHGDWAARCRARIVGQMVR